MVWSIIPLLLICLVIAGIAGSCAWGFGDAANEQKVPTFNSEAAFTADARSMPFPIREPAVPAEWQSNSGSTNTVGTSLASNVGWITENGTFVQLTQTAGPEVSLVPMLGGEGVMGTGTTDVAGTTWVTYDNPEGDRTVWVTDLGDVRIGLLGRGIDPPLATLAEAVQKAQPLPKP